MNIDARHQEKESLNCGLKPFFSCSVAARAAVLALALLGAASSAHAVRLVNKDSHSHDLTVKCSSTAQTSIGASSTRDLGKGPCTVTVKKTGSSASGSGTLTIKGGKVSAS